MSVVFLAKSHPLKNPKKLIFYWLDIKKYTITFFINSFISKLASGHMNKKNSMMHERKKKLYTFFFPTLKIFVCILEIWG